MNNLIWEKWEILYWTPILKINTNFPKLIPYLEAPEGAHSTKISNISTKDYSHIHIKLLSYVDWLNNK